MKVIGFAGFSGAGKTTLVEGLIPTLRPVLDLNNATEVATWLVASGDRFDYQPENYA